VDGTPQHLSGPVAQLGERHNGIVEVKGSNPFGSTLFITVAINQGGTAESSSSLIDQGISEEDFFIYF
jgi:hypothetical protein